MEIGTHDVGRSSTGTGVMRTTTEIVAGGAGTIALGGAVTLALAIIGLAGVAPLVLLEISCIVAGGTLVLAAVGIGARAKEAPAQEAAAGTSASFDLVAGSLAVVLGILALIGIARLPFCAIAAIGLGAALLASSMLPARPGTFGLRGMLGERAGEGAAAVLGIAGIGAVVLGILALVGIASRELALVALLGVGAGLMLTGAAVTAGVVGIRSARA